MVNRRNAVILVAALLAIGALGYYRFMLTRRESEHGAVILLKTALGIYKDRYNGYPKDLRELSEVLAEVSRRRCDIVATPNDEYRVSLYYPPQKSVVQLQYRIGTGDALERFHVVQVDRLAADD